VIRDPPRTDPGLANEHHPDLDLTGHNAHAEEDDSSIMWFAEQCLKNGVTLDPHLRHAERTGDHELAHFFRRAQRAIKQAHNRRATNRTSNTAH
jgi:hypothetical protein